MRETRDRLLHLPVDLGPVRICKVEAIGDGQRMSAGGDDVARRLGDGELGAEVWVEVAVARVAVGRDRES